MARCSTSPRPPRAAATCSARPAIGLTALWRDKQLHYTGLRAVRGRHADFWQVTDDALAFALETLGLIETGLRDQLMQLYLRLDRSRPGCDNCARPDFARQACRTARLGCSPLRSTMPVSWALCLGLRPEHRVMQPLWSKLRTPALATRPRDPLRWRNCRRS